MGEEIEALPTPDSITCPQCGKTSHNPNDVREKYCGKCHQFHEFMEIGGAVKDVFIVQQPDANTNPTRQYRVVLQADVAEALSKDSVVMEDYGRYANRAKAQADADKWNGEGRPATEGKEGA